MSVRDFLLSVIRRWYLILAGLLLTGGLAAGLLLTVPVTYETKSTVLLLPPESSVGTRGNPYLYLGGLAQAVEVLATRMNTTQIRGPIEDAHPTAEFEIGQDVDATGPILAITVSSSSEQDVRDITEQLLEIAPRSLIDMQDQLNVPANSRIGSILLTPDAKIEPVTKTRNRVVIAAVGAGLTLTILLTGLIDGLLLGRIGRRRRDRPDPDMFIAPVDPHARPIGSTSTSPEAVHQPGDGPDSSSQDAESDSASRDGVTATRAP